MLVAGNKGSNFSLVGYRAQRKLQQVARPYIMSANSAKGVGSSYGLKKPSHINRAISQGGMGALRKPPSVN
jgi:hypothetical protein